MSNALEDRMTPTELCEHVLTKIGHKLKSEELETFKKWFIYRVEKVGYLFDYLLVLRCFRIWQELCAGLDHFIVIEGREGFGKSTLSFQIAAWISPDSFDINHICYSAKDYISILQKEAEKKLTEKQEAVDNHD
jgi:hypothetical protein